jgi:hypothetical protein
MFFVMGLKTQRFATPGWQCATHLIRENSAVTTTYFDFCSEKCDVFFIECLILTNCAAHI